MHLRRTYQVCLDRVEGRFRVRVHQIEDNDLAGSAADDEAAGLGAEGHFLDGQTRVVAEGVEVTDLPERGPLVLAVFVFFR